MTGQSAITLRYFLKARLGLFLLTTSDPAIIPRQHFLFMETFSTQTYRKPQRKPPCHEPDYFSDQSWPGFALATCKNDWDN